MAQKHNVSVPYMARVLGARTDRGRWHSSASEASWAGWNLVTPSTTGCPLRPHLLASDTDANHQAASRHHPGM